MSAFHWRIITFLSIIISLIGIVIIVSSTTMDYDEFVLGVTFLSISCILILLANNSLIDATLIFICYFILHYVVMIPLYASNLAWSQFRVFLEDNWPIAALGVLGGLIAIPGYSLGLLIADFTFKSIPKKFEYLPVDRARNLFWFYLIIGILGWILVVISNASPYDTFFGRPAERRGIFGYYNILLFGSILSFLLFLISKQSGRFFSFGSITLLVAVIWMNLAKGARLELVVILLSSFVLYRLLNHSRRLPSIGEFIRSHFKRVIGALFIVSTFSFYTSYRSDVEKLSFPDLLHSVADGAGYLVALDRYPRMFDHWKGKTYLHPLVIYIPSSIFPNKYQYTYGVNEFTAEIFGYDTLYDNTTTSHTYSLIGELYVNFGWFGIPFGMALLGFFNRRMYLKASKNLLTNLGMAAYAIYFSGVLPYIVKSGIVSGVEYFIQHFFLLLIVPLWIMGAKEKHKIDPWHINQPK